MTSAVPVVARLAGEAARLLLPCFPVLMNGFVTSALFFVGEVCREYPLTPETPEAVNGVFVSERAR